MRDEVECRYHGRDFTTAEMALMRSLIAASPQQTRAGLAREFCHAINWVGPDDRIRAMMARLTMLAMHRDGIITLPPPRQAPRRLRKPEPCRETDPPQAPVPETLEAVRPIRLVCITGADRKASRVWNGFVARWHYLGYTPLIGAQMRYAAEDREGRTLALLGFSAAAWKTAPRDAFIGWSPQVREKNLQYVIDNSRYLILPWVRIPNLASHILSEARRQLPQDWYDRYKVAPVLMETFVEIPRFTGAVYKASGWIRVGTTRGRGKYDSKNEGSVSEVYAWAADCCGEAGPRRCPPDHADEMEPSQIAVQVLRGDAAIAAQETLQLAVAAIDRLNVEGIPDPLSGRKVQGFVANAHGRSAGRIAAMTVRNQNDVGIQNRFEHRLQGLGVDRRKNLADGCAAAIGGDQDRHLFIRQAALAGLAATLARLAIQSARSLVALKHVRLVNFDNALEFRPILACGLQETVPPAEGRIDAKSASTGRFPYRLALGQRHAE